MGITSNLIQAKSYFESKNVIISMNLNQAENYCLYYLKIKILSKVMLYHFMLFILLLTLKNLKTVLYNNIQDSLVF